MGGLFGGVLELVNLLGGGILYLFIGNAALLASARRFRLLLGGVLIGIALGAILFFAYLMDFHRELGSTNLDQEIFVRYAIPFFVIPCIVLLIVVILEAIRRAIEKDTSAHKST